MGGFSFSIGGSKSKGSETSSSKSTVTKFDAQSKQVLDDFTKYLQAQLGKGMEGFSKENAIADSQGILTNIFNNFKSTALPQIFAAQGGAGVYNDTTTQLLANNAFGQATSQGAAAVMDNIKSYATLGQQGEQLDYNALLAALGLQRDATATETTNASGTYKGSSIGFGIGGTGGK